MAGAVGPRVEPIGSGSGTVVEGSSIVGGRSGDGGSSVATGDLPEPNGTPPRDSARDKGAVIAEEETIEAPVEYRDEDVAFRPAATAATSSSHVPITKYDIAEHLPDEMLVKLLEENPLIGEMVLRAKEERAQVIAASEAAERAEREQKKGEDLLREAEAEERAGAEAQGPRVTAVAEAGAVKRPDYAAETYIPPTPHLFAPSGFAVYAPQRSEYDDEVVLRDPQTHIANTWSEVHQAALKVLLGYPQYLRSRQAAPEVLLGHPLNSRSIRLPSRSC
ncbi:hypothetical protein RHMOL_Rhmol04G0210100 [Rhododendron molle]|uniref:Uncharacterized protein n=1 Tax=Rhododendron molle TaxID=49168 RepID=A0ACC0P3Y0_RHOML|nr:hypothetical protein RHMOL_Rhmol04G0210100 [Rhododendron molle]